MQGVTQQREERDAHSVGGDRAPWDAAEDPATVSALLPPTAPEDRADAEAAVEADNDAEEGDVPVELTAVCAEDAFPSAASG